MLQARGDINQNPASSYYFTDAQMPLDNLAYTMKTFSATALTCSQFQNHLFEQWTQQQFYELASFRSQFKTDGLSTAYENLRKNLKKIVQARLAVLFKTFFCEKLSTLNDLLLVKIKNLYISKMIISVPIDYKVLK